MKRKKRESENIQSSPSLQNTDQDKQTAGAGKDEMNLAEFPIAKLGRNDPRTVIRYEGQVVDKAGHVQLQKWIVSGSSLYGLPTEFAERVLVALMYLTAEANFPSRKVSFTIYRVLQLLGLSTGKRNYEAVKVALKQLVSVTIHSEGAYFDKESQQRITTERAFHLIEDIWLKSWGSESAAEEENSTGYVIWGKRLWRNFQAGYIKHLDTTFYYSLQNPLARRLYRFLDKRMHYQNSYQIDVFELAARLGMTTYRYPSDVTGKLKPAFRELQERGWLAQVEILKRQKFTRIKFVRADAIPRSQMSAQEASETRSEARDEEKAVDMGSTPMEEHNDRVEALYARYSTSVELQQAWSAVLEEFHWSLPAGSYRLIAESVLVDVTGAEAIIAIEARYQEWVERQMRRKILATLGEHLDQEIGDISFVNFA
jgi:plasmid replication initiation protein